jgi:gas vesicle protein
MPVTCPKCQSRFITPILSIVDVGQHPEAKNLFLSGQINIAVCPQCGNAGLLNVPLVYHDPEKELLFTYSPAELGLPEVEQQRILGDLTNRVMSSLPSEQRKGYLLRPRSFLRLEAMIEAVLEADGITPEMLEAQRAKADLLARLLHTPSEQARQVIAQENDAQIDYEFFRLLTLNIELARSAEQKEAVRQLLELRAQLLRWTKAGREIATREQAIKDLGGEITREGLLEKLVQAALAGEWAKVETMVAVARPAVDYLFYQQLTGRIEAAEQAGKAQEAETLKTLRQTILDLVAELDAEMQQATEETAQFLDEILKSADPEQAIHANLDQIDDLFLSVLAVELQTAERSGQSERTEKLRRVGDILTQLIEESQPPEIQLINQLLAAEYPAGTQVLLEENRQAIGSEFMELMRIVGQDLSQKGREELGQRLAQIREQASKMVG